MSPASTHDFISKFLFSNRSILSKHDHLKNLEVSRNNCIPATTGESQFKIKFKIVTDKNGWYGCGDA